VKGSLENPTWGWMWRVLIICAVLWTFAGLFFGCKKASDFMAERSGVEKPAAVLSIEAAGMQVIQRGKLAYVLDRERELCFVAIPPYRILTPLSGRDCYKLMVNSAREMLEGEE